MSSELKPGPKADILIIDDTSDNLRLLNQMLNSLYKVRLAPDGKIGLAAARSTPPDLILLDVMMPGLNGYEVAARLKADAPTADIPIIFISALDDIESKVRGFTAGGVDYITKPFQEKEVLARVHTHLTLRTLYRQVLAELAERQKTEQAMRASELLYESLVEASPLSICRKDLEGRFTFANRRFLEEANIALADLVGKTDFDLHPPELAEKYRRDDRVVTDSGQVWELIEERSILGNESVVVQSIKTPIYDESGHINGVQISFWDITNRQHAESQRAAALEALRELNVTLEQRVAERTRELAEANLHLAELSRLKDEFVARISHELRTPLANVKLYLQLLEQGQLEKRDAYFQTIRHQVDRLHHLIEDLLDVAHLTLDAIEVRAAPLDVTALLHGLITDWTARASARGLTLAALPAPDHIILTTDHNLLQQALSNVLSNALNYTPRAGAITLRTDRSSTPEGDWVMIEVRDTGVGISAQDLPRIFEPFYRGAAAANYKIPGTGVGLAIAQRLMERLGGRITVESQPGQGAAFTFWLRATSKSESS